MRRGQTLRDLLSDGHGLPRLETTIETADVFGLIMGSLRKSGKPIPINDVWIAAHGLETGSILVTYDDHFAVIPGLRLWPEIGH
jgi:predicted nucleic acid-binding protein